MRNRKFKGFTLVEAIVATAVFVFVVSAIVGTYLAVVRLDRRTRAQRALGENARFIMDFLAKEVRNGKINYPSYPGGLVEIDCSTVGHCVDLYLNNQNNDLEHVYLSGTDLLLTKNGSPATNLNSSGSRVTKLKFYIRPQGDPYTAAKAYQDQPRVTVVLELTSTFAAKAEDVIKLNLQSTMAIRQYPPRE